MANRINQHSPSRHGRRSAGLRHPVAMELQSQTPKYSTGRVYPEAAAGHGRIVSIFADR